MKTIGHRGCALAPENTLAAFRAAHAAGAGAIELDVQCSKDGELVVMHDETLDRTTDGTGKLSEKTWPELERLDAGSWFSPKHQGEKLPRLKDALDWAKDKLEVYIEVKEGPRPADFPEKLLAAIDAARSGKEVHVISFDHDLIGRLETLRPDLDTGILLPPEPLLQAVKIGLKAGTAAGMACGALLGGWAGAAIGLVAGAATGFFAGQRVGQQRILESAAHVGETDTVLPFWTGMGAWMVDAIHDEGKKVIPYTANHPGLKRRLYANGCDAVITDYP